MASNALTARWAATCDGDTTVLSGLGVWPLLAVLADAGTGPAGAELRKAAGSDSAGAEPQQAGSHSVGELLATLTAAPAIHAAVGLWTHRDLPLEQTWLDALPPATHEILSGNTAEDKAHLDAWAAKHTDNLIKRLPVSLGPDTLLVLASALAVRTTWAAPFVNRRRAIEHGPWAGRPFAALTRRTGEPDQVSVIDGITRARIVGSDDIEVHLLLGAPDRPAGEVLRTGIEQVGNNAEQVWQPGQTAPGLEVTESPAIDRPTLDLTACRFTIDAAHDLFDHADLFGLAAARSAGPHFPGISPQPLTISQARQDAMATFSATGFEAAAVTGMAMRASAARRMRGGTLVSVTFDRPFGFLAVHRPTSLVLVAGWIAEPEPWPAN
jgi:serine protease inhibitor